MVRSHKWQKIADTLREQILNGPFKPGQEFPTTKELMILFDTHAGTVQQAVNRLIAEGLVITSGSGSSKRIVAKPPTRSTRCCGFPEDAGSSGRQDILELKIIDSLQDLPEEVFKAIGTPALMYRTRQWRDGVVVAISESYLPGLLPLEEFLIELESPSASLYKIMSKYGFDPNTCRETLIAVPPTQEEQEILNMSQYSAWPVVRITRLVYDSDGKLLEYCLLLDRADCYEFSYEFKLSDPQQNIVGLVTAETPQFNQKKEFYPLVDNITHNTTEIDYICELLQNDLIVLTDEDKKPLSPDLKLTFINFLKSENHPELHEKGIDYNNTNLAAHLEDKPRGLDPKILAFMNIADKLNKILKRYLQMRKIGVRKKKE